MVPTHDFIRFIAGAMINSKTVASNVFVQHWIAILGGPMKTFSNNSGEFIKDSLNMCKKFNIKIQTFLFKSPLTDYVNIIIKQ